MILALALTACSGAPPPDEDQLPEVPQASVDDLAIGAVFTKEMWGDDISPEQERRFEAVAGGLYAAEQRYDGITFARVQALEDTIGADTPDADAVGAAAIQVAAADRAAMEQRVSSICKLVDVLSPPQREARRVAGRLQVVLKEGLPSSATNAYDFAAPWLKGAYDASARSERARVDAGWAAVASALKLAEPEILAMDVQTNGWCVRYKQALAPTQDAWARWHKDSVSSFATWLSGRSLSTRTTFLDTGHLADAVKWSVGTVTRAR